MAFHLSEEFFISQPHQLHRLTPAKTASNGNHLTVTRGALKTVRCFCTRTCRKKERTIKSDKTPEISRDEPNTKTGRGLSEACRFVQNDFTLLSQGIMNMDARARKDVALLSSGFQILDARARKDAEDMKAKAEHLQQMATILKDRAQYRLKVAADKHWSDGALKDDLWRADNRAKQRAMEDALMALEFVKNIHDMMVTKMYELEMLEIDTIKLEKNGREMGSFPGKISSDRITAIQEAYWSMASALSEADGFDYTDPEELELLIATLIDLDAMDGKSSVSLLAECSSSPDVNTRKALAKALASAPSMWTLGNAGMGALQRLAEDSNPAIAAAAKNAIYELRKQWEMEEGDSWRFTIHTTGEDDSGDA